MELASTPVAIVVLAYFLGSVPFGLLFARWLTGKDPRQHGSGNIGATNVSRTGGKAVGALTLLADMAKGSLPVWWAMRVGDEGLIAATATAAFLGHIFPVYLKFRGGKGVATMFGVLLPWQPLMALVAFIVWLLALLIWRYVALASILAGFTLPVSAWLLHVSAPCRAAVVLFCLLMLIRHQSNIQRMRAGTEDRVGERA